MGMIRPQDPRAVYEQIAEYFETLILSGVIAEDEQLPSVRQIAQQEAINPNTVQKAFAKLERDGYIYTVRGKGNFVADVGHLHSLREKKRDELKNQMKKIVQEAKRAQVPKEDLLAVLEDVYAGGEDHV